MLFIGFERFIILNTLLNIYKPKEIAKVCNVFIKIGN